MAKRPVFISDPDGEKLVRVEEVEFEWHAGFAISQKQKSILSLHQAIKSNGYGEALEISSKSENEIGVRLSAFNLKTHTPNGQDTTLEALFQGSKVFENGGPFTDLYFSSSREAKKDPRLRESGRLVKFQLGTIDFPLVPQTAFYDWLYLKALEPHTEWLLRRCTQRSFTDIEFNPKKSINCQAHSLALFFSLQHRKLVKESLETPEGFLAILKEFPGDNTLL